MRRASLSPLLLFLSTVPPAAVQQFNLFSIWTATSLSSEHHKITVIELETAYCHLGHTKSREEYHHYPSEIDAAQSIHQSMSAQKQFPLFNAICTLILRLIIARFLATQLLEFPGIYPSRSRVWIQLCGYYRFEIPKAACGHELRKTLW